MANILIVYGTTDGHTRRIARRMSEVLGYLREDVEVVDCAAVPPGLSPGEFDGVLVLGSVRMGKHRNELVAFVRKFRAELDSVPNAFISVSLSAGRDKASAKREVAKVLQRFTAQTGWRPNAELPIAGALPYTRYSIPTRFLMKLISWLNGGDTDTSRDFVYTDWQLVDDFARRFAAALEEEPRARAVAAQLELVH